MLGIYLNIAIYIFYLRHRCFMWELTPQILSLYFIRDFTLLLLQYYYNTYRSRVTYFIKRTVHIIM